jgi:hypothetical protein
MTLYKVTGETPYLGHQPGEEFEAELDPDRERRAKDRGSIRVLKRGNHTHENEKEVEANG